MSNRKIDKDAHYFSDSATTVRAEIATRIMASFAVNAGRNGYRADMPEFVASDAVRWADALIEELNKT